VLLLTRPISPGAGRQRRLKAALHASELIFIERVARDWRHRQFFPPVHPAIRTWRIFIFYRLYGFMICREAFSNVARFDFPPNAGFGPVETADVGLPPGSGGRLGASNLRRTLDKLFHIHDHSAWKSRRTVQGFARPVHLWKENGNRRAVPIAGPDWA
jgi:hypothetical protein